MDPLSLALLFVASIFAGWINTVAGGGSMLTVPLMTFLGFSGSEANGTNRVGIIMQNAVSVLTFFRKGYGNLRLSLSLSTAAALGAVGGAKVGVGFDGVWFDRMLALILLGVMVIMTTGIGQKTKDGSKDAKRLVLGHTLMLATGFWGGFIQIGVGLLQLPVLNRVMGLDLVTSNAHKVFMGFVFTIVALIIFAQNGKIDWRVGVLIGVGFGIGGYLGTNAAISGGEVLIRRVLYISIIVISFKLLFFN